jgi:nucleotide-binding universal stress UspA family protein
VTTKLIVLPVDGSPTAEAAARFAEDIARSEGATILVVAVAVRVPPGTSNEAAVDAAIHDFEAEQVATEAARVRSAGVSAEALVVEAEWPYEGILQVTKERGADLIVMGTHGRTALARSVIGSVAEKVVRHANVPVVLVPLAGESDSHG